MSPLLAHDVVAGPAARGDVAVLAHGILGSRSNWKGFARRFLEVHPGFTCLLVDLRNHGESHGQTGPHTVAAAADDVVALCQHLNVSPKVLIGHSWGGKAMLELALRPAGAPHRLNDVRLCVDVDSPPGIRTFGAAREEIDKVVDAVSDLPPGLARDRKHLIEELTARGLSQAIAAWMTTNLVALPAPLADGRQFRFKFDVDAVHEMLRDFGALDLWPALLGRGSTARPRVLMVRGGRSDRWSVDERDKLQQATSMGLLDDVVLEKAGHWVHTDDGEGLLGAITTGMAGVGLL